MSSFAYGTIHIILYPFTRLVSLKKLAFRQQLSIWIVGFVRTMRLPVHKCFLTFLFSGIVIRDGDTIIKTMLAKLLVFVIPFILLQRLVAIFIYRFAPHSIEFFLTGRKPPVLIEHQLIPVNTLSYFIPFLIPDGQLSIRFVMGDV